MKTKSKKIQQLVEENFFHKEAPSDEEYEEDNLVKRTVDDILGENVEEFPIKDPIASFGAFKRTTFPGDDVLSSEIYSGKRISRKSLEDESDSENDGSESDLSEPPGIGEATNKNRKVTFAEPQSMKKMKKVTSAGLVNPKKCKKVTFSDQSNSKKCKKVTFADQSSESESENDQDSVSNKNKKVTFANSKTKKVTFADTSSESELENERERVSNKTKKVTFVDPSSGSESEIGFDSDDQGMEEDGSEAEETGEEESVDETGDSDDDEDESVEDESDVEDDLSEDDMPDPSFMYSNAIRDEAGDRAKGEAIRTQLNLCELLLESRITLQKALSVANRFPRPENYEKVLAEFPEEEKNSVIQCREIIWDLLEKFLRLQCKFRKRSPEFLGTLEESERKEYEEFDDSEPKIKRRKLVEYPAVLEKLHSEYIPYRNSVLQKWHDRTRIASGKLAKSDFSAFDLPITKQIEHVLADKRRLIERTHIKRTDYTLVGDEETNEANESNKGDSDSKRDEYYDDEIYDDDDFYHKLLRDYIERKTADVSDPTQLGRKWIKLQSLRSKMKRKIDTRRTKGRKIKFDVHTKLVNFMAPVTVNSWTDNAINELFSSVFGKNLINS